ncbi:hypothetical protein BDY24DRAFT_332566, partial [Mrakia frigida]|uniref:uncharacterized protein n=1 Tax=Mrakia frigida TaxID=29902 RepID=UPI003FCC14A0
STSVTRHPLLPNPLLAPSAPEADLLPPVGLFLGVFSTDQAWERRQTIRSTYARRGKGGGADGLESVRVRFVLGRPSEKWKSLVELEMEAYRDIVLLDIPENMNSGKTHAFFAWAAENAMVPSPTGEKRPDYVSKADDDSFIMLGEMEKRLRVLGGVKVYWGYLIKNTFMGGECYALSLDLVRYVSSSQPVRSLIHGKEDKLVARWMRLHPEKEKILYVSERCWIYDHPKAGTVYAHGYLFPSTVTRMQEEHLLPPDEPEESLYGYYSSSSTNRTSAFTYSSVSQFGKTYRPPLPNLTPAQRVEALVEGSEMSLLSPYSSSPSSSPLPPEVVMARRPTMEQRYEGEWGSKWGKGTVVVHYLKEKEWFLETALAFLGSGN